MSFWPDEPCWGCSGKAQSGTVATMQYLINKFPQTHSMGIYSCRYIGGTSKWSDHACGRAGDCGVPTTSSGLAIPSVGNPIVLFLIKYSSQLGIVEIIYNRVIYDAISPSGRYYGGVSPHRNHIHYSQAMAKAKSLTYASIVAFAGFPGGTTPPPLPPSTDWTDEVIMALPTVKRGNKNLAVARAQGLLVANGYSLAIDKAFGPNTEAKVKAFQTKKGLKPDGIVGKKTWTKLLGQ